MLMNHDIWYSEYLVDGQAKISLKLAEILHTEKTAFQDLKILNNEEFGNFMVLDGYIQVTEKDEFIYHEMICHPAMAVNPNIKKVLIIGGGDGGTAREVSGYPGIEKIDMVEIDESVVKACIKYMPTLSCALVSEPRLNLMIGDGLKFVSDAPDKAYDLIIVDSTDPEGPGEDLFTVDFYNNCFRVLTDEGILINQHEGAFFDGDAAQMQKAHNKLKQTFPIARVYGFNIPTYASGYWYFGFASKKFDPLADFRAEAWNSLGLKTKYYNTDLHTGAFALPNYVRDILAKA